MRWLDKLDRAKKWVLDPEGYNLGLALVPVVLLAVLMVALVVNHLV